MVQSANRFHQRGDERLPRGLLLEELLFPGRHLRLPLRSRVLQSLLGALDVLANLGNPLLFLGGVNPRLGLVRIVEEREQAVVFIVSEGVELVGMALGALRGQPQDGLADAVDPVEHLHHTELLGDDRPFLVDHAVAEEPGRDDLRLSLLREEVPGELLDQELVIGHVAIDRVHDPIAPFPLLSGHVLLIAVGIRIARGVEPGPRPFFPITFALEEAFDGRLVPLLLEPRQVGRRGGEADQVEVEPTQQRAGRGGRREAELLRFEVCHHEGVDRISLADLRELRLSRGLERPVRLVRSSFLNPSRQGFDLPGRERLVMLGRGHAVGRICGGDPGDQLALVRLARHDGGQPRLPPLQGFVTLVETKPTLAPGLVFSVAQGAMFRQDRLNFALKADRSPSPSDRTGRKQEHQGGGRTDQHGAVSPG